MVIIIIIIIIISSLTWHSYTASSPRLALLIWRLNTPLSSEPSTA